MGRRASSIAAMAAGYVLGAIPFSQLASRRVSKVDLRTVGSGTVSGTGLYEVAGFKPLAVAGVLDVAKGAVVPYLVRRDATAAALAGGAAVVGHNWSPFLDGAGGRGISPAIGVLLVTAPAGAAVLLAGLAIGRLAGETAVGSLVADAALVPVVRRAHGRSKRSVAFAVLVPMLVKRLAGNRRPTTPGLAVYVNRLLYDRDTRTKAA